MNRRAPETRRSLQRHSLDARPPQNPKRHDLTKQTHQHSGIKVDSHVCQASLKPGKEWRVVQCPRRRLFSVPAVPNHHLRVTGGWPLGHGEGISDGHPVAMDFEVCRSVTRNQQQLDRRHRHSDPPQTHLRRQDTFNRVLSLSTSTQVTSRRLPIQLHAQTPPAHVAASTDAFEDFCTAVGGVVKNGGAFAWRL